MGDKKYVNCRKCQCEISMEEAEKYGKYCKKCFKEIKKLHRTDRQTKKSILLGLLFLIIVFVIILIKPVMQLINKNDLSNKVKNEILNDIDYLKYTIEGKYNNHLTIQLNDDFEEYDYTEKEKMIKDISNQFEKIYKEKEEKFVDKNDKNYINNVIKGNTEAKVTLISQNNKYSIDGELIKNDEEYSKKDYLKEKIRQQLNNNSIGNKEEIINMLNSTNYEEKILNNILNISDVKEKSNEIIYQTAKIYTDDDYEKSLELFQKIPNYKDSKELIKNINEIHELDGEWYGKYGYSGYRWIIDGNTCYNVYSDYKHKYTYDTYYCKYEDNILYIFDKEETSNDYNNAEFKMKYKNGKLIYSVYSNTITLSKESDNTTPKEIIVIKEPAIGMTKDEVLDSTWGKPKDINKTTTAYGTREQWCYSGYKYIYFKNGIVTSIQD